MRRFLLPLLVAGAVLPACGGSDAPTPPERAVMRERFPVAEADLVARVEPATTGPETGELMLKVMEVPGVRVAETDYEAKLMRVLVFPDADRRKVRDGLAALPGIADVE
jgi:hypothetical protein